MSDRLPKAMPADSIPASIRAAGESKGVFKKSADIIPMPVKGQDPARLYAGAQVNRLTSDWTALGTSADSEILTSIRLLRARSREMVRDNPHAKNVVRIVQNNVVGQGIGIQCQIVNKRGKLNDKLNSAIEAEWANFCRRQSFHAAGLLDLTGMLRLAMGQLVEAGEGVIRKVYQRFGDSKVPVGVEFIEADRLMDQWQSARAPNGNEIRMGVEIDQWGRPEAYWFFPKHPGDYQFQSFQPSKFIRIPASEIIHFYIVDRWPQTRGVPMFHSVLRKMNDMKGYTEAEIVAARASAAIMGFITSPEEQVADGEENGNLLTDLAPGTIQKLNPGESFSGFAPTRPNTGLDPFMRYMLREMAAGVGVSYESLSRDYSQSNYSSSRLALLDDRDTWRVLQGWLITTVLHPLYIEWLDLAVLSGTIKMPEDYYLNKETYQAVRFKPRGWSWIDPLKEVKAYSEAVRAGFMTVSDVIGLTAGGADAEDMFKARRQELDLMQGLDLTFDTDPSVSKTTPQVVAPADPVDPAIEDPAPGKAADE